MFQREEAAIKPHDPTSTPRVRVWLNSPPGDRRSFQLQWIDPATGRRKSRSAGTNDHTKADDARVDLEYKLNKGLPIDTPEQAGPLPWTEFRERYLSEHCKPTMRERSREKVETVLDSVEATLKPKHLADLDNAAMGKLMKAWRTARTRQGRDGLSVFSQHSYRATLLAALRWAASPEVKLLHQVPEMASVRLPKRMPVGVPAADIERLLQACEDPAWRVYLQLALWAGLRLSEAHHVRWSRCEDAPWIDLDGKRLWFPWGYVKGVADQWVPLHPGLLDGLLALPREHGDRVFLFRSRTAHKGEELTRGGLSRAVGRIASRAGIKAGMQALRRTFGCRLAGKVPAAVLQRLMRHASIATTMRYYASAEDSTLRDAIDGLE